MKFYVSLAFCDPKQLVEVARAADEAGFEGVTLTDHLVFPEKIASKYPYVADGVPFWAPEAPWPDPWVSIGAMAAVTTRLRFLTAIYVLPLRDPVSVAKAIATAAVLSGDRVTLGAGAGWLREEFALTGQPFSGRGERMEEMIEVLRALWSGEMVEHHGRHYDLPPVQMSPAPAVPVPIYVGGESTVALQRAARLADGWISVQHTARECAEFVARLDEYRGEAGRAELPFERVMACVDAFDLDGYAQLAEVGVTALQTVPWLFYGGDPNDLDVKRRGIERFATEVLSQFPVGGAR